MVKRFKGGVRAGLAAMAAALSLGPASAGAAPGDAQSLPPDQGVVVNGVEAACTGIGQTRNDPQWAAYPVRVEFANGRAEYLVGAVVSVSDATGAPLLSVSCDAPWVLLKLAPGDYKVFARLTGSAAQPRSAAVRSPRSGQVLVVMRFPDAD
jgi:hypothetical protein